jgi:hypothetical protein
MAIPAPITPTVASAAFPTVFIFSLKASDRRLASASEMETPRL